ncbi:fibronectin type III domain-containing protein [bacterium]|nr:fibronectin type III domain-containing protein [bacterium]
MTPITVPGAPTGVAGTEGHRQVDLTWTAPASNGGSAITDYVIEYSSNSGTSWTTFADGTSTTASATVTGLTNGTAYIFRVSAVNAAGTGAASSNSASDTPYTATGGTITEYTSGGVNYVVHTFTGDGTLTLAPGATGIRVAVAAVLLKRELHLFRREHPLQSPWALVERVLPQRQL